jgi:hypothetical protein
MKYAKESCCQPAASCPPMSFEHKAIPGSASDGKSPMSLSKKAIQGGESRPSSYRLESKKA